VRVYVCVCQTVHLFLDGKIKFGVATISRLLKMIRLFCKRALWKRLYSAEGTDNSKEPTNRSHPIHINKHTNKQASVIIAGESICLCVCVFACVSVRMCLYFNVCICVGVCMHKHVRVHVHTGLCVYAYVLTYQVTYLYTCFGKKNLETLLVSAKNSTLQWFGHHISFFMYVLQRFAKDKLNIHMYIYICMRMYICM